MDVEPLRKQPREPVNQVKKLVRHRSCDHFRNKATMIPRLRLLQSVPGFEEKSSLMTSARAIHFDHQSGAYLKLCRYWGPAAITVVSGLVGRRTLTMYLDHPALRRTS